MGRTIIQSIGPLYGEAVNGTVYGRPNGSIYVPDTNEIVLTVPSLYVRFYKASWGTEYNMMCSNLGASSEATQVSVVAKSQDIASYIQLQISDDEEFGTYKTSNLTAGNFNAKDNVVAKISVLSITNGGTYYLRAQLIAQSGVPVATSDTFTLTGWASE